MSHQSNSRGLFAMILAYALWGLVPVYWKALHQIGPFELLQVRLVLTCLTCLAMLPMRGTWERFRMAWSEPDTIKLHGLAALLLATNWYSFMWAVSSDRVLESSLGYYLCPLVSVVLGRFLEKESLGGARLLAVLLAAAGVGLLIVLVGQVPLAAIVIAVSWSSYGLIKKRNPMGNVVSLSLETSLLSPIALIFLIATFAVRPLDLQSADSLSITFLLMTGVVTTGPLLLFAFGAQRLRLTTMGMGQYIVPTAHFFLAVYYGEPVSAKVILAFVLIWIGLALYSLAAFRKPAIAESR